MTTPKKQPAAKAKRPEFFPPIPKPHEFSTPAMVVYCHDHGDGSRSVRMVVDGFLSATMTKNLNAWLHYAAAWVADAPKKGRAK